MNFSYIFYKFWEEEKIEFDKIFIFFTIECLDPINVRLNRLIGNLNDPRSKLKIYHNSTYRLQKNPWNSSWLLLLISLLTRTETPTRNNTACGSLLRHSEQIKIFTHGYCLLGIFPGHFIWIYFTLVWNLILLFIN